MTLQTQSATVSEALADGMPRREGKRSACCLMFVVHGSRSISCAGGRRRCEPIPGVSTCPRLYRCRLQPFGVRGELFCEEARRRVMSHREPANESVNERPRTRSHALSRRSRASSKRPQTHTSRHATRHDVTSTSRLVMRGPRFESGRRLPALRVPHSQSEHFELGEHLVTPIEHGNRAVDGRKTDDAPGTEAGTEEKELSNVRTERDRAETVQVEFSRARLRPVRSPRR